MVAWASGADVTILSAVETPGAAVIGVDVWHAVRFVRAVIELVAEVVLDVIGGVIEYTVNIRGEAVSAVMDLGVMLWVLVGAGKDPPIVKVFECFVGV
jgi:hypothetical protein